MANIFQNLRKSYTDDNYYAHDDLSIEREPSYASYEQPESFIASPLESKDSQYFEGQNDDWHERVTAEFDYPASEASESHIHTLKQIEAVKQKTFVQRHGCWLFSILGLLVVGLFIFLGIYFSMRSLIETAMKDSKVDINSVSITEPTERGFRLMMDGVVTNGGILDADVQPTVLTIHNVVDNGIVGTFEFPGMKIRTGRAGFGVNAEVRIIDANSTATLIRDLINRKETEWVIKGTSDIAVLGKTLQNVEISKSIYLPGASRFSGFWAKEFQMNYNGKNNGSVGTKTVLSIKNDSPVMFELGGTSFVVLYNQKEIGLMATPRLAFATTTSQVPLSGFLVTAGNSSFTNTYSQLLSDYVGGKTVYFGLKTSNSSVSWVKKALADIQFNVELAKNKENPINGASLSGIAINSSKQTFFASQLRLNISWPLGFPVNLTAVRTSIGLIYNGATVLQTPSNTEWVGISSNSSSFIPEVPYRVVNAAALNAMSAEMFSAASLVIGIKYSMSFLLETPFGIVAISDIIYETNQELKGLSGLDRKNSTTVLSNFQLESVNSEAITATGLLSLESASSEVSFTGRNYTFNTEINGTRVGIAEFPQLRIGEGASASFVKFSFSTDNQTVQSVIASILISSTIQMTFKSIHNDEIAFDTTFTPQSQPLVRSATRRGNELFLNLANPLRFPINIWNIKASFQNGNDTFSTAETKLISPLVLQGASFQQVPIYEQRDNSTRRTGGSVTRISYTAQAAIGEIPIQLAETDRILNFLTQ